MPTFNGYGGHLAVWGAAVRIGAGVAGYSRGRLCAVRRRSPGGASTVIVVQLA